MKISSFHSNLLILTESLSEVSKIFTGYSENGLLNFCSTNCTLRDLSEDHTTYLVRQSTPSAKHGLTYLDSFQLASERDSS